MPPFTGPNRRLVQRRSGARRKHQEVRRTNFHPMEESAQHARLLGGWVRMQQGLSSKRYSLQQYYPKAFLTSEPLKDSTAELIGIATIPKKVASGRGAKNPFPTGQKLTEADVPPKYRALFRVLATDLESVGGQIQFLGAAGSFSLPRVRGPTRTIYYYVDRRSDQDRRKGTDRRKS